MHCNIQWPVYRYKCHILNCFSQDTKTLNHLGNPRLRKAFVFFFWHLHSLAIKDKHNKLAVLWGFTSPLTCSGLSWSQLLYSCAVTCSVCKDTCILSLPIGTYWDSDSSVKIFSKLDQDYTPFWTVFSISVRDTEQVFLTLTGEEF